MQTFCVSCKKDTENKDAKVIKAKNERLMLKPTCLVCGNKKSRFVKKARSKRNFIIFGD